jgi:hypothetical protein
MCICSKVAISLCVGGSGAAAVSDGCLGGGFMCL